MFETTGGERHMEELEAKVLGALDLYFESRRHEVEQHKKSAGPGFEAYEELRRQLAEAEEELVELRRRSAELQVEAVDTIVGGGEVSDLAEGVSELQQEIHDLAEAEKAARKRKAEAEESLRSVGIDYAGTSVRLPIGWPPSRCRRPKRLIGSRGRSDQQFAEGRTSVLGAAN